MARSVCSAGLAIVVLLGCGGEEGPELGTVEGTVKLDGNTLSGATVTFSPVKGGRSSVAVTDENGRYVLKHTRDRDGALIGAHKVSITTATTETDADGNDVVIPEKLPAKYNAETELEKNVEAGSNEFNFDLDSKGRVYKEGDDKRQRSGDCCS